MRAVGFLSNEIVRRAMPLVMAGAAGAAGAVLAQRRLGERRKLSLASGPPSAQPAVADPAPPSPGPQPGPPTPPAPTPEPPSPTPTPDPIPGPPTPAPEPPSPTPDPIPAPPPVTPPPAIETPQSGVAVFGEQSQGPEAASDVIDTPSEDVDLEQAVRSALLEVASDGAGAVDVEIAGRMVVLRGQVDSPETIRELERAAAGVLGVEGVRVLLHLPGRASRRSR
ncbi:MAG TPA: BON domain-containing protein [Thermoleophilaceae bacterium]|nr:BON domain-containing protein [Thermoleophilaceae bacterium]